MNVKLIDMLKSGVHFGHQTDRWHPKMQEFIFSSRNGVHIIDLEKTLTKLQEAVTFVEQLSKEGKTLLFVGTKRQAKEIVKEAAIAANMPYLIERWIGGFLTNFPTVSRLMSRLRQLKADEQSGALAKYKKHEQMAFKEEIERLTFLVGGVEYMEKLPDALFVIDIKRERTAIKEARKMGIPVVALCDTNVNPDEVDYVIPANDDATKSVKLLIGAIADAVIQGKSAQHAPAAVEPKKV